MKVIDVRNSFLGVLTITLITNINLSYSALPNVIKPCPKDTEQFKTCLKTLLDSIRDNLGNGNFESTFNMPKLEPMYLDVMQISGNDLNINMTGLYVKGASTYKVLNVKPDIEKLQFDIELMTPQLTYTSQYSLSQKFPSFNVDVRGHGDISGAFDKVHSKLRVKFRTNGNLVELERIRYKIRIGNGRFKISSLSNANDGREQNKLFTEIANNFINADPSFILRKIEPSLETNFIKIVTVITESLFKNVTVNDLFLE